MYKISHRCSADADEVFQNGTLAWVRHLLGGARWDGRCIAAQEGEQSHSKTKGLSSVRASKEVRAFEAES